MKILHILENNVYFEIWLRTIAAQLFAVFVGFFGASVLGLLLIPMYYIRVGHPFSTDPNGRMENVKDAFVQMGNNWQLILAVVGERFY